MSGKNIILARRQTDETLAEARPDGATRPLKDKTDWNRLYAMAEEEVAAAAQTDPGAQPRPRPIRPG